MFVIIVEIIVGRKATTFLYKIYIVKKKIYVILFLFLNYDREY